MGETHILCMLFTALMEHSHEHYRSKILWLVRSWIITAVIIMFLESSMFGISSSNRNRWSV